VTRFLGRIKMPVAFLLRGGGAGEAAEDSASGARGDMALGGGDRDRDRVSVL
jgi:hypothetical protein